MSVVVKEQFTLPEGVQITKCKPGVARGLKASDYVESERRGWSSGPRAEPISSGDPKFDMYANALPAAIRKGVVAAGLDVRAMYKEYRLLGRDRLVEKYSHLKQEN